MEADLSAAGERYRHLSLWWDLLPGPVGLREPLPGDAAVDVAVVGGGLTGLWTALYLAEAEPGLRIMVIDRDIVGFGASGRNGGWCSALFAASEERLDRVAGPGAGRAMRRAMETTNLAGRTLRDLVLGRETGLTGLPWVGHRSKRWEPEPLRYLGINAGLRLAASADRSEERAGRTTWRSRSVERLLGGLTLRRPAEPGRAPARAPGR